jgi:hypothetical protein
MCHVGLRNSRREKAGYGSRFTRNNRPVRSAEWLEPRTLTISAAGLTMRDSRCEGHSAWSDVGGVDMSDRYVIIYGCKPLIVHLIPKTAFATPADAEPCSSPAGSATSSVEQRGTSRAASGAERFYAFAKECWERSQQTAPIELPAAVETGNPYQAPTMW